MNEEKIEELERWGFERKTIEDANKNAIKTTHQAILLDDETLFNLYKHVEREAEIRSKNQLRKGQ